MGFVFPLKSNPSYFKRYSGRGLLVHHTRHNNQTVSHSRAIKPLTLKNLMFLKSLFAHKNNKK